MHIMPRGHIETDPSISSYFVTLRLSEGSMFDLDSSSVIWSLIGLFVFRSNPVSNSVAKSLIGIFVFTRQSGSQSISTSLMQWWNFGSSLIDGEFKKDQYKTLLLGS